MQMQLKTCAVCDRHSSISIDLLRFVRMLVKLIADGLVVLVKNDCIWICNVVLTACLPLTIVNLFVKCMYINPTLI